MRDVRRALFVAFTIGLLLLLSAAPVASGPTGPTIPNPTPNPTPDPPPGPDPDPPPDPCTSCPPPDPSCMKQLARCVVEDGRPVGECLAEFLGCIRS